MKLGKRNTVIVSCLLATCMCACTSRKTPSNVGQFPSPMVDTTRPHDRVTQKDLVGTVVTIDNLLPKPIDIFIPAAAETDSFDVLVHLHGASFLPAQAAAAQAVPTVAVTVHLGFGSSAYEKPFETSSVFPDLLREATRLAQAEYGAGAKPRRTTVTAFSAGYGAVRAILRRPDNVREIDELILIDGLHASYEPERLVLAEGGRIDSTQMAPFVAFAHLARQREKKFLITHSEIFPGTYASTTETADYLLAATGISREPMLETGPLGMQQLSEASSGNFFVMGFAGNSAPDHVDHFHGYAWWLERVDSLPK